MNILPPDERSFLEWLNTYPRGIAADKMTAQQYDRAQSALRKNYVSSYTLVPPGSEREFFGNHGLLGYRITPDGIDALALDKEARQHAAEQIRDRHLHEQRENKRDRKDSIRLALEIAGIIISFVSGIIAESHLQIVEWIRAAFR